MLPIFEVCVTVVVLLLGAVIGLVSLSACRHFLIDSGNNLRAIRAVRVASIDPEEE